MNDAEELAIMVIKLQLQLNKEKAKNEILNQEITNLEINYLHLLEENIQLKQLIKS